MTINWRQEGEFKQITATGTVAAGDYIASGGVRGFALNAAATGETVEVLTRGQVRLTKATGFVPAKGDPAFFDIADASVNADFRNNPCIGEYAQAALTGDTGAWIQLNPDAKPERMHVERIRVPLAANDIQSTVFVAPWAGKVVGIDYYTTGKPGSSAGTIALTSKNVGVSDNALFSSVDLEGITENALTSITLTATPADLVVAHRGLVEFLVTSNNADALENDGVDLFVYFQRT